MRTAFYVSILLFIFSSSKIISQDSTYIPKAYRANFILKKSIWPASSINMDIDTGLNFSFFTNYYYDLNLPNIHTSDTLVKNIPFSTEKIKIYVLDREKVVVKVVVFDPLGSKIEEGLMKAIGPFKITVLQDEEKNWQYFHHFYLLKIGEWRVYSRESVRLVNYDCLKKFDLESQSIKDIKDMAKRRKKFIKQNKLPDDYVE